MHRTAMVHKCNLPRREPYHACLSEHAMLRRNIHAPQGLNISHSKNLIFNFAIDILSFFGMPDRRIDAASQHAMLAEASVIRLAAR